MCLLDGMYKQEQKYLNIMFDVSSEEANTSLNALEVKPRYI